MRARNNSGGYGIFTLALFALLLTACAPKPDPEPVWRFQPDSIQIRYIADSMLNGYNGSAHTLVMVIYQLSSREAFDGLARNGEGMRKLLEVGRFDPSVVGLERVIVQPGEKSAISLDRAENARWVGIALGYFDLNPDQATRVFAVDYRIERTGRFRRVKTAAVQPLTIDLRLGPGSVHTIGVL